MKVLATTATMSRDEWLQLRKQGIGGSDVAAICGLNPWKSAVSVYNDKLGLVEDYEPGEKAYWGNKLESLVAEEFAIRTGFVVRNRNAILQHEEYPFMLANLDRIITDYKGERGVLEIKTSGAFMAKNWDDRVPEMYLLQVHHYLAVTGLSFAYVALLIGGQEYRHYRVERDEELIAYLIKIETDFWQCVETKTLPAVDGSDDAGEAIRQMFPEAKADSAIDLPMESKQWILTYEAAKQAEAAAKTRKEEAAQRLQLLLKDSEVGTVDNCRVAWKNVTTNRLDTNAIKKDHPDIYAKYTKASQSRRFTISELKGE